MNINKQKLIWKRIIFYILSFTWGGIMSLIGLIVIGICAIFKRVHVYHGRLYAEVGQDWGGLELGCFFVIGKNCHSCCAHEAGHGLQNIFWGPLMPFVICIPSAIRYWYREIIYRTNKTKFLQLPPYDSVWFESQATRLGKELIVTDKI